MLKKNFHLFFMKCQDSIRNYISFLLENLKSSNNQWKQKNINFSLDDSFKFHFLDLEENTSSVSFFHEIVETFHPNSSDCIIKGRKKETLEMNTETTILSTIQSMPILIKNLLLGHLQTFIKNKQVLSKYENIFLNDFDLFMKNVYLHTKNFISSYTNNQTKRRKMFKDLLKKKIEDILNNQYFLFLNNLKKFFLDIKTVEDSLKIANKKEFPSSLETALIQSEHYLNVLKFKDSEANTEKGVHGIDGHCVDGINGEKIKNAPIAEIIPSSSKNSSKNTSFQLHEILKFKDSLKNQSNKNLGENLLLFEQIETDLKNYSTRKENEQIKKVEKGEQEKHEKHEKHEMEYEIHANSNERLHCPQIDILLEESFKLQEAFLNIKHEMYEIATKHYEEFQNLDRLNKKETIKSILEEMSPGIHKLFEKLNSNKEEGIQKVDILDNMLKSTLKEIEEQKKINKHLSLKIDLCLKHFHTSAQMNFQNDQETFLNSLEDTFVNHIKNFHLLK